MLEFRLMYLKKYLGFVCCSFVKYCFYPSQFMYSYFKCKYSKKYSYVILKCKKYHKKLIINYMIFLSFRVATNAGKAGKSFFY